MKNLKMIRTLIQLSNGALTGIVSIVKSSTPVSKKREQCEERKKSQNFSKLS